MHSSSVISTIISPLEKSTKYHFMPQWVFISFHAFTQFLVQGQKHCVMCLPVKSTAQFVAHSQERRDEMNE